MKIIICFIIAITTLSCGKHYCENPTPVLNLQGFDSSDSKFLKIDYYERSSGFSKLIKTIYTGTEIKNSSSIDSIPLPFNFDVSYNYKLEILNTGTIYSIHEFSIYQASYRKDLISAAEGCKNGLSYFINTTEINDQPVFHLDYGQSATSQIVIYKKGKY